MAEVDLFVKKHATLQGHISDVTWVDFSYNILATCSSDKTVRLWDASNFDEGIRELDHSPLLGHRYTVHCCCFSPFGNLLATCSMDGYVILWNPKTGGIIETLTHPSSASIRVCKFSPNSSYLATGSEDDTLVIWDVLTRKTIRLFKGHDASVTACSFTPDNNYIISGSTNGDLRLWDVKRGNNLNLAYESEGHDLGVMGCEFSPVVGVTNEDSCRKRYLLATCGNDDCVRLFNVIVGVQNEISLDKALQCHEGNVMCCKFSSNGKLLASASGDKTVIIWDVLKRTMLTRLIGHQRYVTSCAFSFQNNFLASGSNDKTIIVWKIKENKLNLLDSANPTVIRTEKPMPIIAKDDGKTPNEYFCPITHELMNDPVIAADGFSYERRAIHEWLQSGKASSPMTNQSLTHMQLTPNYALKMLIQRHLESS